MTTTYEISVEDIREAVFIYRGDHERHPETICIFDDGGYIRLYGQEEYLFEKDAAHVKYEMEATFVESVPGEPGIWVYIRGQGVNLCEHLYHIDEDDDDAIAEYVADVLYDWWGVGEC